MTNKKSADLSSGLLATKGQAAPVSDVPARDALKAPSTASGVPLNFRVSAELRRRFKMFAASRDLKLNELLRLAFDEYERHHR